MTVAGSVTPDGRPTVSVIVPFAGRPDELLRLLQRLSTIARAPGDELIVVDNNRDAVAVGPAADVTIVRAAREGSPYYARNVGAAATTGEWLLFTDADCIPESDILDAYLGARPPADIGAFAGQVAAAPAYSPVGRYAETRGRLDQSRTMGSRVSRYGATANLLVRRQAFEAVGGFCEGIRSGGDKDLCLRLDDAGWRLELQMSAVVRHEHRADLRSLWDQTLRYGRGAAWLRRRHNLPSPLRVGALRIGKAQLRLLVGIARADRERLRFAAYDTVCALAYITGALEHNGPFW